MEGRLESEGERVALSARETFHLHRVLRLKQGDACQVFNRRGQAAHAVVEKFDEQRASLRLQNTFHLKQDSLYLKVAQALPQHRKMDELVDRAQELGVQELWIMETERNIVKMKADARERVKNRWEQIAISAAKQSGSPVLMKVDGPLPMKKILDEKLETHDQAYLFHPDPQGLPFNSLVENLKKSGEKTAFLFFGPEGGFTGSEIRLAEERGAKKVFLGDFTLRLETAFTGVLAALRFLAVPR